MTFDDFRIHVMPYIGQMFPKVRDENAEQKQMWFKAAEKFTVEQAREAVQALYMEDAQFVKAGTLAKKLQSMYRSGGMGAGGGAGGYRITQAERDEHEQKLYRIKQIIDSLTDEQLNGHALMHAAGAPTLLWTAALDPRRSTSMRAMIARRINASLQHDDAVRVIEDRQTGRITFEDLDPAAVARAREYQAACIAARKAGRVPQTPSGRAMSAAMMNM